MSTSRRWPPALVQHAVPRLVAAGGLLALALFGAAASLIGARESRDFEQRAVVTLATVLADTPGIEGDDFQVPVRYDVAGRSTLGLAPVADRGPYQPGEQLPVRYDPRRPSRVQFVDQPYDLSSPLAFSLGIGLIGLVVAAAAVGQPLRLVRLARSSAPTYAFQGRLGYQDRRFRSERLWLLLDALDAADGAEHVAAVPLLRGQRPPPRGEPFGALVKGHVRDGATAVALVDDEVLWPGGRVRVGEVAGLTDR